MCRPQPLPRTPWNDASLKKEGDAEGHLGREKKETIGPAAAAAAAAVGWMRCKERTKKSPVV